MQNEFSHIVKAGHIHAAPQLFEVTADAPARAALAARFGLNGIAALSGRFTLRHEGARVIAATLGLTAEVTQICVITLEPFEAAIAEQARLRFVPAADYAADEELGAGSLEEPDEIPYENDVIDLGEALAEQLALALDPYPRKPGAALPEGGAGDDGSPFAALKGKSF